jgi:hypothetical protein
MPRLLLASLLLLSARPADALELPPRWRWANPAPHGNNIADLAFLGGVYVQAADRGRIYTSTDGVEWTPRPSGTTRQLRAVGFHAGRILVTGEAGAALYAEPAGGFLPAAVTPATEDWLEAVAASPTLAVAVGDNGAIYTSAAGTNWSRVTGLPFTAWLRAAAWARDTFVAVGEGGFVTTSNDGQTWRVRASGTTRDLNRVVWDGARFLAAGAAGTVLFSANSGVSWIALTPALGVTNAVTALAVGGDRLLAAGDGLLRSRPLAAGTWTDELAAARPAPPWGYLAAVWNGAAWLAAGRTGMLVEGVRTDGVTAWTELGEGPRLWLWDVARFPDTYVAVGDRAAVLTSGSGVAWAVEAPPPALTNRIFLGVGGRTNLAVAVGTGGALMISPASFAAVVSTNAAGQVVTNTLNLLGLDWRAADAGTTNTLQGVAAADAGPLVVVGDAGTVLTSADGTNWTRRTVAGAPLLSSVAAFPGGYVATGDDGALLTSPDAEAWTPRASGTTNWLYRVRFLNGLLLACGQNGTLLTSLDGAAWTPRATGTSAWLNDVAHAGDAWFALGTQGTVLASTNAADWFDAGSLTGKALYGAAVDDGQLVAVGVEGVILRAQIIAVTNAVEIAAYAHEVATNRVRDAFLFIGRPGQQFELEAGAALGAWTRQNSFELAAPDGSLVYLQDATNPPAPPPERFFRTLPLR